MPLAGNMGEWSEIYIFLKLMYDRKVYAADKDMNKIDNVFLNIIKIIREELRNYVYDYYTGDSIKIYLNDEYTGIEIPDSQFKIKREQLFRLMSTNTGTFSDTDIEDFLSSIHISKLKSPATSSSSHFGGTQDITMTVVDYRDSITRTIGFSCKSDFAGRATLFNASADNTNFLYEITGPICDELMEYVNSLYITRGGKEVIPTGFRMRTLKDAGCDLAFISPCKEVAERNLVLSGGNELPSIVAEALKYYYWIGENNISYAPLNRAIDYVIESNPGRYHFEDISSIYKSKFSALLYNMFTGMRLGTLWNGRSSVNGGYIVMKNDGDVLAYHSCIADEFKDFLLNRLGFETPSASRHRYLNVFKENGKYYIKLNLQLRFI